MKKLTSIEKYEQICDILVAEFELKHDVYLDFKSGYMYHFNDYHSFSIEEIILDLRKKEHNAFEWFDYIFENDKKINFQSYIMGAR